jgi:hypothetical protein
MTFSNVILWTLLLSIGGLFVSYILGIVAIEYLKIPIPQKLSKKFAALIVGGLTLTLIIFLIIEISNP